MDQKSNIKDSYQLIIVGAGPAGMAAALTANQAGLAAEEILLLDRNDMLGGILPQCIHDGFGLFEFKKSLTGPEYAENFATQIKKSQINYYLKATVLKIIKTTANNFNLTFLAPQFGKKQIIAQSIILATGCRESSLAQLNIPGSRPAGIYTAGAAQYMMNIQNYLPGKSTVILGLGDIGLIMARRMHLEGINVKLVLGAAVAGLLRNYIQCIKDFKIPLKLGYTIISTHGYKRLKGVNIAPINNKGQIDYAKKEYLPCDTLLVAAGLIPETELWQNIDFDLKLNNKKGIPVAQNLSTPISGLFACGNVVQVYDTADEVSQIGRHVGLAAYNWLNRQEIKQPIKSKKYQSSRKLLTSDLEQENTLMVCTLCPQGCSLTVEQEGQKSNTLKISGNNCRKGLDFAKKELKNPSRIITTTIKVSDQQKTYLLPVKTKDPIAKNNIMAAIKASRKIKINLPVKKGDIISTFNINNEKVVFQAGQSVSGL